VNYKELKDRYYKLEKMNSVISINNKTVNEVLEGLETLRDKFLSTYFEFETIDQFQELEDIKIKITENILLCKLSSNAFKGISNRQLEKELDDFYASNGRVY